MAGTRGMIVGLAICLAVCATACRAEPPVTPSPDAAQSGGQTKPKPGLAVGIVFDTSGSMLKTVADSSGKQTPKHVIAARSLRSIIAKIETHQKQAGKDKGLDAGLYIFKGRDAVVAVPFGAFNAAKFRAWIDASKQPDGSTPLGHAVRMASDAVLQSPLENKHVLIVTDGINTAGPEPSAEMKSIQTRASTRGAIVLHHFIAFDVAAREFEAAKNLGATVLGAANEKELNEQLDFILEEKILLEKE